MKKVVMTLMFALLLIFPFNHSMAQNVGFKGIGRRLGLVKPEGVDLSIGFGAHVHLGEIIENLVLFPSIDYWSKSTSKSVTINGDFRYYFPSNGKVDFFAGSGLAFSFNSVDRPLSDISENDIGLNLLGGADFPVLENIVLTLNAKFTVSEDNAFKMFGGITFLLGE